MPSVIKAAANPLVALDILVPTGLHIQNGTDKEIEEVELRAQTLARELSQETGRDWFVKEGCVPNQTDCFFLHMRGGGPNGEPMFISPMQVGVLLARVWAFMGTQGLTAPAGARMAVESHHAQ